MFAARVSTRVPRSPGRLQRADARQKPDVSNLAIQLLHRCECCWHMLEKRVFYAALGALADHLTQVRNTKTLSDPSACSSPHPHLLLSCILKELCITQRQRQSIPLPARDSSENSIGASSIFRHSRSAENTTALNVFGGTWISGSVHLPRDPRH